jgi:hypothetical protein
MCERVKYKKKILKKYPILKSLKKGVRSGSVSQRYGSPDPDPHQNVTDPQHLLFDTVKHLLPAVRYFVTCKTGFFPPLDRKQVPHGGGHKHEQRVEPVARGVHGGGDLHPDGRRVGGERGDRVPYLAGGPGRLGAGHEDRGRRGAAQGGLQH